MTARIIRGKGPTVAPLGAKAAHKAAGGELRCICGGDLVGVMDSRPSVIGLDCEPVVRRRRHCDRCGERTTTLEIREDYFAQFRAETLKEIALRIISGEIK